MVAFCLFVEGGFGHEDVNSRGVWMDLWIRLPKIAALLLVAYLFTIGFIEYVTVLFAMYGGSLLVYVGATFSQLFSAASLFLVAALVVVCSRKKKTMRKVLWKVYLGNAAWFLVLGVMFEAVFIAFIDLPTYVRNLTSQHLHDKFLGGLATMVVEVALATFLFSFVLPLFGVVVFRFGTSQVATRVFVARLETERNDPSLVTNLDRQEDWKERWCSCWSMFSPAEVIKEAVQFTMGRVFLLNSPWYVFFFAFFKDFAYDLFHFGVRYSRGAFIVWLDTSLFKHI